MTVRSSWLIAKRIRTKLANKACSIGATQLHLALGVLNAKATIAKVGQSKQTIRYCPGALPRLATHPCTALLPPLLRSTPSGLDVLEPVAGQRKHGALEIATCLHPVVSLACQLCNTAAVRRAMATAPSRQSKQSLSRA